MDRKHEIAAAVADVRAIEKSDGVTRDSLEKIKQRLMRLARPELFPASDFPPPAPGGKLKSCLYRVSEDPDHRFALGDAMRQPIKRAGVQLSAHPGLLAAAVPGQSAGVSRMYRKPSVEIQR